MVPYLAKLLGPKGVRVNAIAPGLIDTEMTHPEGFDTTEMLFKPAAAKSPMGRTATIEDCANAILFLASNAASIVTGQ
jgi:3-oxoacyl-[acyl-carrier protein] reductase